MDDPSMCDDEIIPGSDDEETSLIPNGKIIALLSRIQTPFTKEPISTISNETTDILLRNISSIQTPATASSSDALVEDYSTMPNIAERAKMRSRKLSTQQTVAQSMDVIELSSDDEYIAVSKSKPKKAKQTKSTKKSKHSSEPIDAPPISTRPRPRPRPRQDTSSIYNGTFPIPFALAPSPLPPSDPPSSTATSLEHPTIETLPHFSHGASPSYHSSGKKNHTHATADIDELDSDPGTMADTRLMHAPPAPGPPPTFFAGSSSPTSNTASSFMPPVKTTTAVKKARKKDTVEAVKQSSHEPRAKPKRKTSKVEVVIEQSNVHGKGKEKDVFKSKEFIDDSDDNDECDVSNKVTVTAIQSIQKRDPPSFDVDDHSNVRAKKKRKIMDRQDDELDSIGQQESSLKTQKRTTGKGRKVIESDEEDDSTSVSAKKGTSNVNPGKAKPLGQVSLSGDANMNDVTHIGGETGLDKEANVASKDRKENAQPVPQTPRAADIIPDVKRYPSISARYEIAPKTKSTPMADLIRRVNSKPGSPFCSPAPRTASRVAGTAYSPYVKSSRSTLARIAPLHPNRRTPPPPLPPPPPKKKTKKELEREDQWEEELIDSVGGITEWACMSDAERAAMRKAKREQEMYGWED
ncbi:hypothetical protein H0H93_001008 [Arthromyces matolae]|nr:hypothetical protein H0H93_001008 [Arthromyces matolae]